MSSNFSFDVVSKIDGQELDNAISQTMKEIGQRFDFKGSVSNIEKNEGNLMLTSDDEYKIKSLKDILENKLIKRGISLKFLEYKNIEPALGGVVKQEVVLKQGIPKEKAKEVINGIKETKYKVQSQIQGDEIRVSSKSKDDLQGTMKTLREKDFGIVVQFTNFR
ncbi:MAG: YajQ family cyclic di-GMP-binding protein [bacterium]